MKKPLSANIVKKPLLAIILLTVGIFMLLEGSRLSGESIVLDLVIVVVGAVLTVAYLPLMGDYLEKRFSTKASFTYMPIFALLGLGLLWQAAGRHLAILDKVIFGLVGAVLFVGSAMIIYRTIKSR